MVGTRAKRGWKDKEFWEWSEIIHTEKTPGGLNNKKEGQGQDKNPEKWPGQKG